MALDETINKLLMSINPFVADEDKSGYYELMDAQAEERYSSEVQSRIAEMNRAAKRDALETAIALRTAQYEIDKISNQRARTDAGQAVNKARRTRW
jgi:hypothetical protein